MSSLRECLLRRLWNFSLPQYLQNALGEMSKPTWLLHRRICRPANYSPELMLPSRRVISSNMLKQYNEVNKALDVCLPTSRCSDDRKKNLPSNKSTRSSISTDASSGDDGRIPLSKLRGKFMIVFKCKKCGKRNMRVISKVAYKKGVVIVACERCLRRHLIADNLNWFPNKGKGKNVEEFLKERGERVRQIKLYVWLKNPEEKPDGEKQ